MRRLSSNPFLPPLLLLFLFLGLAPAMGEVRDLIFRLFPAHAVRFLALALAGLGGGIALWALLRIHERRAFRYGALALTAGLLWLQIVGFNTGLAQTDVAEKVHIFQYGLIAFLLCRAVRALDHPGALLWVCCATVMIGTLEEGVQWLVPRRTGELRDVGINIAAGWTGVVFSFAWRPPEHWTWTSPPGVWRGVRRMLAGALLGLGIIVFVAHLGYEIRDPRVGRFRSWHTAEELRELSTRRAQEWAANPPKLPIWGLEDYYLTEAAWHANHRNVSSQNGDAVSAWNAHRILEIYYAPFLDLPRFRGSGVHRYPPDVRRELRRKAGNPDLKRRVSPVLAGRIWIRPSKPVFLGVLLLMVTGLWWWPGSDRRCSDRR